VNITLATDMALKRQQWFIQNVEKLAELMLYACIMVNHDDRERIVNHEGKVISRWK
jgi:hypothetical protein